MKNARAEDSGEFIKFFIGYFDDLEQNFARKKK